MINRCIGCYYHDCKENVCTHGSPIFIDDECTDYEDNDFIEQIKAEERKNFAKKIIELLCIEDEDFDKAIISPKFLKDYIEQMLLD